MIAQSWKCSVCGNVSIGLFPPDSCPVCGASRESFEREHEYLFPDREIESVVQACRRVSYGLYVVTSMSGERMNGQICNTLFQITSDPPRFAVGINHKNMTHEFMLASGVFAASILGQDNHRLVRRFGYRSGREFDKFKNVSYRIGRSGCPILEDALGWIECRIIPEKTVDAGTHSIFVGDVLGGGVLRSGEPMTYAYYQTTKDEAR